MEWLESAEINPIKIDKDYGKKQSNIALILMLIVISFILGITLQYTTLIYGDVIIRFIRSILNIGNFINIIFGFLVVACLVAYVLSLIYSIRTIILGNTGVKNKVNTKITLKRGITYLIISNISMLVFIGLIIANYFIQK